MIDEAIKIRIMENLKVLDIKDEKDRLNVVNKILRPEPFYHSIYKKTERDISTCYCCERWEKISDNEQYYTCSICKEMWSIPYFKNKNKKGELKK